MNSLQAGDLFISGRVIESPPLTGHNAIYKKAHVLCLADGNPRTLHEPWSKLFMRGLYRDYIGPLSSAQCLIKGVLTMAHMGRGRCNFLPATRSLMPWSWQPLQRSDSGLADCLALLVHALHGELLLHTLLTQNIS